MTPPPVPMYYLSNGTSTEGPFAIETLHSKLAEGSVKPHQLCWTEGMSQWAPIYDVLPPRPVLQVESAASPALPRLPRQVQARVEPRFFYITPERLLLLNVLTFGFYTIYWQYKNWRALSRSKDFDIIDLLKACFGLFFMHTLLTRLKKEEDLSVHGTPTFSPIGIYLPYFAFGFIGISLPGNNLFQVLIFFILVLLQGVVFISPQKCINRIYGAQIGTENYSSSSTIGHIVMYVIAALLWLSLVAGLTGGEA